ncbi:MAG: hypothetical protein WCA39_15090, partial [Nitrososphaeraceae archaeon]
FIHTNIGINSNCTFPTLYGFLTVLNTVFILKYCIISLFIIGRKSLDLADPTYMISKIVKII